MCWLNNTEKIQSHLAAHLEGDVDKPLYIIDSNHGREFPGINVILLIIAFRFCLGF